IISVETSTTSHHLLRHLLVVKHGFIIETTEHNAAIPALITTSSRRDEIEVRREPSSSAISRLYRLAEIALSSAKDRIDDGNATGIVEIARSEEETSRTTGKKDKRRIIPKIGNREGIIES
ncbi:hypothetical protein Trydic_g8504, partial [Trypoxylus dichotomus]